MEVKIVQKKKMDDIIFILNKLDMNKPYKKKNNNIISLKK